HDFILGLLSYPAKEWLSAYFVHFIRYQIECFLTGRHPYNGPVSSCLVRDKLKEIAIYPIHRHAPHITVPHTCDTAEQESPHYFPFCTYIYIIVVSIPYCLKLLLCQRQKSAG